MDVLSSEASSGQTLPARACTSALLVVMRIALSVGALALALALPAIAEDIPKDQAGFTEYVAGRLRVEIGGEAVVTLNSLTLKLGGLQANLDRIFAFCNNNAGSCSAEVANYVKGTAETVSGVVWRGARRRDALQIVHPKT
jgi:hypothetical protein